MNEIMLEVSRIVSPCAICDLPSSRSWTSSPSMLHAEAKLKRVLVELSRKRDIPRPLSKTLGEMLFSLRHLRASATVKTASSSSLLFSHVRKKSFSYISEKFSSFSFLTKGSILMLSIPPLSSSDHYRSLIVIAVECRQCGIDGGALYEISLPCDLVGCMGLCLFSGSESDAGYPKTAHDRDSVC